jgi:nitrite transporter NirC
MYSDTIKAVAESAYAKAVLAKRSLPASLIHSAMAGAYIGLSIVLIFALATPFASAKLPGVSLIMGATFGIALSLVIFSGSDLFTGNTMVMTVGALSKRVTWKDFLRVLAFSYFGNLLGSVLVAFLSWQGGVFQVDPSLVTAIAAKKMHAPFDVLFYKGVLCNWLVVLAVWSCFRLKSEAAKLIMVWWCLLGFIGSGYEHSVANMTLLTLANFMPHDATISWDGWVNNLIPVTLGNIFSGAVLMGMAYFFIEKNNSSASSLLPPASSSETEKTAA